MINKMPSGKKYIFSVLSAVRGFMVATPLLALVDVAVTNCLNLRLIAGFTSLSNKDQILNCGMKRT